MEELDRDKLDKLAGFIMILRLPQGTVKQECVEDAYKNAKAVASELFPPQTVPLVWRGSRSDNYFIKELSECVYIPQIRNYNGHAPRYDDIGPSCYTLDEAKSFCEASHQQKFLRSLK